jgi:hypothetical protein
VLKPEILPPEEYMVVTTASKTVSHRFRDHKLCKEADAKMFSTAFTSDGLINTPQEAAITTCGALNKVR